MENALIVVFFSSLLIIVFYTIYFFSRILYFKSEETVFTKPISIIICAKDELDNLKNNLPKILEQDYPVFEVIVVNDQSIDGTGLFLKALEKKHSNLIVVDIDKHINRRPGKKFALTLGIKTATYEYVLLSDADCSPQSNQWAQLICNSFNSGDIVLGYGGYERKGGLLNKMIRFDTFNVASQYFSFALAGHTYMGVGRNLAYKKSLFFDNKGFASHIHISSGDDDLFIQEVANQDNVSVQMDVKAHTISEVVETWKDWIYQKRRHLTASHLYQNKFKILLLMYPSSQMLFWLSFLLLLLLGFKEISIILLSVRLLVSYLVNYRLMKYLGVIDLYWIHPLYEIFHLIFQVIFVLLNILNKPKTWNK